MHFAGQSPRRVSVVLLGLVLATAGCQAGPAPRPTASGAATAPSTRTPGAVRLRELGFSHAPEFELPGDVQVIKGVDQPNVVTLVMSRPSGPVLSVWVSERAGRDGWRTTARSPEGILFEDAGWSAAFTAGDPSGLTFRRRP